MVKQETPKKEKVSRIKKLSGVFTWKNVFLLVLCVVVVLQYMRTEMIFDDISSLEEQGSSMIKEIGETKDASMKEGKDLNEVRKYLNMPLGNYVVSEDVADASSTDDSENTNRLEVALFKYVEFVGKNSESSKNIETSKSLLNVLTTAPEIAQALQKNGELKVAPAVETEKEIVVAISGAKYGDVFSYVISKEDGKLYLATANGEVEVDSKTADDFKSATISFIEKNVPNILSDAKYLQDKKTSIEVAFKSPTVTKIMTAKGMKVVGAPVTTTNEISYQILNKSDEPIAKISLDKKSGKINMQDLNNEDVVEKDAKIPDSIISFFDKLDARTNLQRKADESIDSLKATMRDSGFKSLIKSLGLKFSEKLREDAGRIYFDLYSSDGKRVSSIVVEKATGIVNITQPDGTNSENLLYFDPEFKKKTLVIPSDIPNYGDTLSNGNGKMHILLAGRQGSNVDTIILVQLDEKTKKARMVSIPRDLFYNGRKINAYWASYGMKEFIKVLQDVSGYKIDKYVHVDMFGFIDIVDLIGGIDIHLDKALTDPNYRVVNNGVEGTLHYEPGDYHMGGVEALRIARSRKTTSDFSRAERQQMIIKAIQEKAKSLGLSDISTVYEVAKVVLAKVETNVSFEDAIAYYFKYKDYVIESNAVMSSANVLFSPPYQPIEDCQKLIGEAATAGQAKPTCETDENHAYTLVPQNEDWNVIKWYFKQQFE